MSHNNSQPDTSTSTVNATGIDRDRLMVATVALQGILAGCLARDANNLPNLNFAYAVGDARRYADEMLKELSATQPAASAVTAELMKVLRQCRDAMEVLVRTGGKEPETSNQFLTLIEEADTALARASPSTS